MMGEHNLPRVTRPDFFNAILRHMNGEAPPAGWEKLDADVAKLFREGMAGDHEASMILGEAAHHMELDGWPKPRKRTREEVAAAMRKQLGWD